MGQSTLCELHPCCLGVYCGAMSKCEVKAVVEAADGVLMVGAVELCDLDTSLWTHALDSERTVGVDAEHGVCSKILGNHPQVNGV